MNVLEDKKLKLGLTVDSLLTYIDSNFKQLAKLVEGTRENPNPSIHLVKC